jgi:hypothetical protein
MNKELDLILLRGPRTDDDGNKIPVTVSVVRKSETDLSNYSFLCKQEKLEEWVPTKELKLYRMILK